MFGSLEKSRDRSKSPLPSTPRSIVSVNIPRTSWGEGVEFTREVGVVRQLHEGLATRFGEPHGGEEAVVPATNRHLGEMQPSWDL